MTTVHAYAAIEADGPLQPFEKVKHAMGHLRAGRARYRIVLDRN